MAFQRVLTGCFSFASRRTGAVAVEAAACIGAFLLLVVGIIEWGVLLTVNNALERSAYLGAERGAITRDESEALTAAKAAMIGFAANCVDLDVEYFDSHADYLDEAPAPDDSTALIGRYRVSCEWSYITPYFHALFGSGVTLKAESVRVLR
jgi:hypothetical protein